MPTRPALLVTAVVALALLAGGCGSGERTIRIGVLTDCQGPFHGLEDAQLSGVELPFLRRGARLAGAGPSHGVTPIQVGGRRVELVRGCQETGEHTVYIEEARRLLENEHVDVVVGGSSTVTRDLAHRYPGSIFVSAFWDEQEVTMRRPASNLFRFTPDYAQQGGGARRVRLSRARLAAGGDRRRRRYVRLGRRRGFHGRVLRAGRQGRLHDVPLPVHGHSGSGRMRGRWPRGPTGSPRSCTPSTTR